MRRESSTVVALVGEVHETLLTELTRSPNVSVVRAAPGSGDGPGFSDGALRRAAHRMTPFVLVAADPLATLAAAWQAMWDLTGGPLAAAEFEARAAELLAAARAGRFELPDYYLVLTHALAEAGAGQGPAGGPGRGVTGGPGRGGPGGHGRGVPGGPGGGSGSPGQAVPGTPGLGMTGATGLYLGPLRASRPRRVELVVIPGPAITSGTGGGPERAGGPRAAARTGQAGRPAGSYGTAVTPGTDGTAIRAGADGTEAPELAARVLHALRSLRHGPWWPPLDDLIDAARNFYPGALTGPPAPHAPLPPDTPTRP